MKIPTPRKLKSGTWFIQLRLGGESIPVTARTKKDCEKQAQYVKAQYLAGKRMAEEKKNNAKLPTLGEAIDLYIEKRDAVLSPSTIRMYKGIRKNRFKAYMSRSLSDIEETEWQVACNLETKTCGAKTLKNAWSLVSSAIQEYGIRPPRVKLPQIVIKEHPFLAPEQIRPFINAVHGTNIEIPALLALHSLRRSEIAALRWENIDFQKRLIKVKGAAVHNENGTLVFKKENKNATSARTVPIMIDELYDALNAKKKQDGLIVTAHPNSLYKSVNTVCKRNQLPLVGIHGLRHSFVSLAYHLGVPEKVVMEIGGWADFQTMRKIYTHIARSDVQKYTDQFAYFFAEEAKNANKSAKNVS